MGSTSIVWFRLDLRLSDNQAVLAAAHHSDCVVPVYIDALEEENSWAAGAASRWWLHQSLRSLDRDLQKVGSRLIIRSGDSAAILLSLIEETGARSVFWNRVFDPVGRVRDQRVEESLRAHGAIVQTFNSCLLHEPHLLRTGGGNPFQVFTPFWNRFTSSTNPEPPTESPKSMTLPQGKLASVPMEALALEPRTNWASGLRATWTPGEYGAHRKLRSFIESGALSRYATGRDRPDHDGVSMLSPHLHFGEIGPRQIWHAARQAPLELSGHANTATYLKELGWREFAYHVLYNFPDTINQPLRPEFDRFPWSENESALKKWQRGQTGYPIVDAGMRQLWQTGWMHNRVRMIVASFLTKDLLISWLDGARWFWDTLVDADLGSNTLGWQWAAGCGADAAPYFRIFNPVLQGEKFDSDGDYVRRWVPELARLPSKWIHSPWQAPPAKLTAAGVELGRTYPARVVDHAWARDRALEALSSVKRDSVDKRAVKNQVSR